MRRHRVPRVVWVGTVDKVRFRLVAAGGGAREPYFVVDRVSRDSMGRLHWVRDEADCYCANDFDARRKMCDQTERTIWRRALAWLPARRHR